MIKIESRDNDLLLYFAWVTEQQILELRQHVAAGNIEGIISEIADVIILCEEMLRVLKVTPEIVILNRVKRRYSGKSHEIVKKYVDLFVTLTKSDGRYLDRFCTNCGKGLTNSKRTS